jgi:uncharacterized protein (DUF1778 family)
MVKPIFRQRKTAALSIRLEEEIKAELQRAADAHGVSLSAYTQWALGEHVIGLKRRRKARRKRKG